MNDLSTDDLGRILRSVTRTPPLTSAEDRALYAADVYSTGPTCAAVVRPADVEELSRVVRAATAGGYRVVPRGAGLTYTGGYAVEDPRTVMIDLTAMKRILEIAADDLYITVEAGCTWKQIHDALSPLGLRLPCFGTHSGALATVGGGLSGGAVFFGTARYGTVADSLLGLEVVLADGRRLRTGQGGFANARKPAYRSYGPDLTGLFVHDAGALAIKAHATFRLIRAPAHTGYGSFAFASLADAAAALSEVARAELAEDAYVLDPASTRRGLSAADLARGLRTLAAVARNSGSVWEGVTRASRMAIAGKRFIADDVYSLHVVAAARSTAALEADLARCAEIAKEHGGVPVVDTIPRATRANPFPPVNAILNSNGERWTALNAKVAHTEAATLVERAEGLLASHAEAMQASGVTMSRMLMAMSTYAFSYEPVFLWSDEWLPIHRATPDPDWLAKIAEPAPNLPARALVHRVREELLALFAELGAASNQIGRTYPYLESLQHETRWLVESLKGTLDPDGAMNPGALGLRRCESRAS